MRGLLFTITLSLAAVLAACTATAPTTEVTPTPTAATEGERPSVERLTAGLVFRTLDADWGRTPEIDRLVQAAQSEGTVHITTYDQAQVDAWCAAFTAEFGVECHGRGIGGGQVISTLTTERQAGEATTDVLYLSMSQAQQLLDRDYIAEVDWAALGIDSRRVWQSQGPGNAVGAAQSQYTHFYNKRYFTEQELPRTLSDWLDPRYKGQACSPDFLFRAGSGFAALFEGMDRTVDRAERLIDEQELVITSFCDPLLISGERPLMFMGYGNPPTLLEGNPIGQFWNPGMGVNLFSMLVPDNAPHSSAARLFAAWATSREASRISYEAIGQGWAAYGHGPEGLVTGQFAQLDLVYESPLNFAERGENTRTFEERVFGAGR